MTQAVGPTLGLGGLGPSRHDGNSFSTEAIGHGAVHDAPRKGASTRLGTYHDLLVLHTEGITVRTLSGQHKTASNRTNGASLHKGFINTPSKPYYRGGKTHTSISHEKRCQTDRSN